MSKTVDELMEAFRTGFRQRMQGPGIRPEGDIAIRAGIAAVIRALRDDMRYMMINRDSIDDMFDKILGDAGDEVAGGTSAHSREAGYQIRPVEPNPATAPAPAVCVWTLKEPSAGFVPACSTDVLVVFNHDGNCPFCGKPIKFTEAK